MTEFFRDDQKNSTQRQTAQNSKKNPISFKNFSRFFSYPFFYIRWFEYELVIRLKHSTASALTTIIQYHPI
jgi:hypothetical protein